MSDERIKVIYILSNGRSGSTLLDLLLGVHPRIWTLGEAQMLPWMVRWGSPCGCGEPHDACPFWKDLLPDIPLEGLRWPIEHFRGGQNSSGKVLRWGLLPSMLEGRAVGQWAEAAAAYGQANAGYFQVALQAARHYKGEQVDWLVDASKDPYRLLWLESSGLFDLRVVHLFKDPEAFVYSMTKSLLPRAANKVARFTGRWLFENSLFSVMGARTFGERMLHLPYTRLASDPEGTMRQIGARFGLQMPAGMSERFRTNDSHGVSGNPMRWENSTVRLDEKWRTALPAHYARAVGAVAWPLARVLDGAARRQK